MRGGCEARCLSSLRRDLDEIDVVVRCVGRLSACLVGGVLEVGSVVEFECAARAVQRKRRCINAAGYRITALGIRRIGIGGSHREERCAGILGNRSGGCASDNRWCVDKRAAPVGPGAFPFRTFRLDPELIVGVCIRPRVDEVSICARESHGVAIACEGELCGMSILHIVVVDWRPGVSGRAPTDEQFIPTVRIHLREHCHSWRGRRSRPLRYVRNGDSHHGFGSAGPISRRPEEQRQSLVCIWHAARRSDFDDIDVVACSGNRVFVVRCLPERERACRGVDLEQCGIPERSVQRVTNDFVFRVCVGCRGIEIRRAVFGVRERSCRAKCRCVRVHAVRHYQRFVGRSAIHPILRFNRNVKDAVVREDNLM